MSVMWLSILMDIVKSVIKGSKISCDKDLHPDDLTVPLSRLKVLALIDNNKIIYS